MVGATIDAMSESTDAPRPHDLRSFWSQLPREGRWLLSTVAIQLFGRGMTLPFTVIYLHEVRGIGLDVAGLLMAWIFTVGVLLTGPGGVAVDKYGARLVTLVACLVHMVGVVVLAFAETVPAAIVATTLMGVSGVTWPAFNSMVAAIVQGPLRAAVLRRQLRPGQPRHRAGRRRQRPLRRRDPTRAPSPPSTSSTRSRC